MTLTNLNAKLVHTSFQDLISDIFFQARQNIFHTHQNETIRFFEYDNAVNLVQNTSSF